LRFKVKTVVACSLEIFGGGCWRFGETAGGPQEQEQQV